MEAAVKHYPPAAFSDLLTDAGIRARLHCRLAAFPLSGGKERLGRELGIKQAELTRLLRGQMGITPAIAAKLGFRAVTRFERID